MLLVAHCPSLLVPAFTKEKLHLVVVAVQGAPVQFSIRFWRLSASGLHNFEVQVEAAHPVNLSRITSGSSQPHLPKLLRIRQMKAPGTPSPYRVLLQKSEIAKLYIQIDEVRHAITAHFHLDVAHDAQKRLMAGINNIHLPASGYP